MTNWKDYIDEKFQPNNSFTFSTDDTSNTLTITHKSSGTYFLFHWISSDWNYVADIQFYNPKTIGWSGEFNGDLTFDKNVLKQVDHFLSPAFETGWTSKDVYLFRKHFQSIVYWNLTQTGKTFQYYSSDLGCLSIILLPLFQLLSLLVGRVETVQIEPIKSPSGLTNFGED